MQLCTQWEISSSSSLRPPPYNSSFKFVPRGCVVYIRCATSLRSFCFLANPTGSKGTCTCVCISPDAWCLHSAIMGLCVRRHRIPGGHDSTDSKRVWELRLLRPSFTGTVACSFFVYLLTFIAGVSAQAPPRNLGVSGFSPFRLPSIFTFIPSPMASAFGQQHQEALESLPPKRVSPTSLLPASINGMPSIPSTQSASSAIGDPRLALQPAYVESLQTYRSEANSVPVIPLAAVYDSVPREIASSSTLLAPPLSGSLGGLLRGRDVHGRRQPQTDTVSTIHGKPLVPAQPAQLFPRQSPSTGNALDHAHLITLFSSASCWFFFQAISLYLLSV
eukprot:GHVT01048284.1.p1 GENE.GHVT01048284.1~~GHVT01048284.1.p1  ORF type:complete len:333 (+),score=15.40 GHVT01048284.1:157-1155(+)